ncbi:phosphoglycerate mutase [Spirochaetia bacterium]|nr:phosphoglycerate mutase [Spirochaetia bacterium]
MKRTKVFALGIAAALIAAALIGCASGGSVAQTENGEVTLYVTRHGRTLFNTVHRAQGWSDSPLTVPGVEVAEQLGRGLKDVQFIAAYSSDSGRARETARLVLKNNGQQTLPVGESELLRESCFGSFEGAPDEEMWGAAGKELGYETYGATMQGIGSGKFGMPEVLASVKKLDTTGIAEDFDTVKNRMQKELKIIAEQAAKQGGGNVLVVAHGISILAMIDDMTDKRPAGGQLENASVTKIVYKDGTFSVLEVGSLEYVEKGK